MNSLYGSKPKTILRKKDSKFIRDVKARAKEIRFEAYEDLTHVQCLHLAAKELGFTSWDQLCTHDQNKMKQEMVYEN